MSTIKVTNIEHASTGNGGIQLDSSGHVTVDGVAYPSAGSLSGRNRIINGDMRIDQRNDGASVTVNSGTSTFGVDRWKGQASGGGVYTQQSSSIAPAGFSNSTLLTVTTADSSIAASDYYIWGQAVEGFNAADFAWGTADAKTLTLSFWVRASVTGTYALFLGNNADNRSIVYTYTISAANTWEQKSIAISGDTSGTWATDNSIGIGLWFTLGAGSNFNATAGVWNSTLEMNTNGSANWIATNGATFYITGVQLEVGSVATPFEHRNYGDELARCQRYFQTSFISNPSTTNTDNDGVVMFGGSAAGTTTSFIGGAHVQINPEMRATPTITLYDLANPRNTGKCQRHVFGLSGANNQGAVIFDQSPKSFLVRSDSGHSGSGIIFHYKVEAEL